MAHYGKQSFDHCLVAVVSELARNEENHPDWPADSACAARIVLKKAQGLVKVAANDSRGSMDDSSEIAEQALQTGAMALRFLLNIKNAGRYELQMHELEECLAMDPYEGRY